MRATAHVDTPSVNPFMRIEHKDDKIDFNISTFHRKSFKDENFAVLDHINEYWNQLPPETQDAIFNIYKQVEYGIDNIYQQDELTAYLSARVTELIKIHDYNKVLYWVRTKSNIIIPTTIEDEYQHSFDNNTTREKTYTKSDYIQLAAISLLQRTMVPIWGEFIFHNKKNSGKTFKEYTAFQLLRGSGLLETPPMEKLLTYTEHIVGPDKHQAHNIHAGISSEEFCSYAVALLCVRRLCLGNIAIRPEDDQRQHLVSLIFKFIRRLIQGTDQTGENAIRDKKPSEEMESGGNGDKISTQERYRFKFKISPGENTELEHSVDDINKVVSTITYRVTPEMLAPHLATSQRLLQEEPLMPMINIMRWIMRPVISPRGMMFIHDIKVVEALGACEAILWEMGHHYLAVLITSYRDTEDRAATMRISHSDSRMYIPDEMIRQLNQLYPFHRAPTVKRPEYQKNDINVINPTIEAIDDIAEFLRKYSWRPTCSDAMLQQVFGSTNRRTPVPPDIKTLIAQLVIELGERRWS